MGNEGPCCNVQGKESFGFCKTKAVLKTNASRHCAHHLLKTNRKPIASLTVHTTLGFALASTFLYEPQPRAACNRRPFLTWQRRRKGFYSSSMYFLCFLLTPALQGKGRVRTLKDVGDSVVPSIKT